MTKRILITGAGSGFGRGAALQLARNGHDVIATVHVGSQKTDLLADVNAEGLKMTVEVVDITNPEDRDAIFAYEIDILVNDAGIMEAGPVSDIPMAHVRKNYEVNVFGTLAVIQGFLPQMVKRGKGKIVTVTSMGGLITVPFVAIYTSTKHALEGIVEGLKSELVGTGVEICTVNPGGFQTGFNDRGAETMGRWFDPAKSMVKPEVLAGLPVPAADGIMPGQMDPQAQIDDLVKVVEEEGSKFRNVCPDEIVPWIKAIQEQAWKAKGDDPIWVDPSA